MKKILNFINVTDIKTIRVKNVLANQLLVLNNEVFL